SCAGVGTATTPWHAGQRIFLPASSSLTRSCLPQGHDTRMAMRHLCEQGDLLFQPCQNSICTAELGEVESGSYDISFRRHPETIIPMQDPVSLLLPLDLE